MLSYVKTQLEKAPSDATHYVIHEDTREISILKLNPTTFWSEALHKWIQAEPWDIKNNLHKAIEIK